MRQTLHKIMNTKFSLKKFSLYFLAMLGVFSLIHFGVVQYNHYEVVNANSSLYQTVRRNDLNYLHHGGNKLACVANWKHAKFKTETDNNINNHNIYYYYKHSKIYKPDKHGNYWSYFENHQSVMNDDPNGRYAASSDGNTWSSTTSGILANKKVLSNHGVHSGVNFIYTQSGYKF